MELWKTVIGMGELAESQALDTIVNGSGLGMRECWKQRLKAMRSGLEYAESSSLERLLIQHRAQVFTSALRVEKHNFEIEGGICTSENTSHHSLALGTFTQDFLH